MAFPQSQGLFHAPDNILQTRYAIVFPLLHCIQELDDRKKFILREPVVASLK